MNWLLYILHVYADLFSTLIRTQLGKSKLGFSRNINEINIVFRHTVIRRLLVYCLESFTHNRDVTIAGEREYNQYFRVDSAWYGLMNIKIRLIILDMRVCVGYFSPWSSWFLIVNLKINKWEAF